MKARTLQLESREKLLIEVFQAAIKKLPSVQEYNDYEGIVKKLIVEAAEQLGAAKVIVSADKETAKLITDKLIKAISSEIKSKIETGEPLKPGWLIWRRSCELLSITS